MSPTVPEEPTAAAALASPLDRRRRLKVIPVALICALGLVLGYLFLSAKPEPGTPLGASAVVPGGTARIKGIVPLENDGWLPPEHVQLLEEGPAAGAHRVRVLVQFSAVEAGGIFLDTSGFVVSGLGGSELLPLWASPFTAEIRHGESLDATLVFELPDKAIALVLKGPDNTRLSLGVAHHTGR
ncbi:hypothetical protein [Arthrobacter sp. ZGTC131]|uniref:hypothetical protein n=1 Tax=Arthrobacter sp. ZGTC131 TaxID=2058898 RepID=UPI00215790D1|nr:hypothetical protein [Arthrobacter sp. ZGTC131]